MPITLAEAKVGMADKVAQQVIDSFRRSSLLLDSLILMMLFHQVQVVQHSHMVMYSSRHLQQLQ